MSEKKIIESLNQILADTYGLLIKTQNFHWNVVGQNFNNLHALFEKQYDDLFEAIDQIAERIRGLGEKVPASLSLFAKKSHIGEGNEHASDLSMVKTLLSDHQTMITTLKKVIRVCDQQEDKTTCDLLEDRLGVHEKAAWMLKALTE